MNDMSAAELEREAEATRARIADTAETLKSKMTPGQLLDDMTQRLREGDAWAALNNLKAQARDNPLPLALIGTGLAWLMFGHAPSRSRRAGDGAMLGWADERDDSERVGPAFYAANRSEGGDGKMTARIGEAAGAAAEMAGDAADTMRHAFSDARDSAAGVTGRIKEGARHFTERSKGVGAQARERAREVFEREPLVLAALGLTLGTALGALLPHTRLEDETLGGYGKEMRRAGEELYEKGVREVKDVASDVYGAAKEEADRQGLTGSGDGKPIAERMREVMKTAEERTEEAVRERTEHRNET